MILFPPDSAHKSHELKLLETFIVFKTLSQEKQLNTELGSASDCQAKLNSSSASDGQAKSNSSSASNLSSAFDQVKLNSSSVSDSQVKNYTGSASDGQVKLKQTLVTGINRRHFSLKQVWDMLIKCSIQSVGVNQSVKMNILHQHPAAYSSGCE